MTQQRGRPSPLNPHAIQIMRWMRAGHSISEIVEKLYDELGIQTQNQALHRLIERDAGVKQAWEEAKVQRLLGGQTTPEGVHQVDDDTVIITGKPGKPLPEDVQIADILRNRNLDPDEWEVKQVLDNQWEANAGKGKKITLYQFKIWLARKVPISLIFPATPDFSLPKPEYRGATPSKPLLVMVCGDQQAPYHDLQLHALTLEWLAENKPDVAIVHGDLSDFGDISRHRDDPAWDASAQDCIKAAFGILWDYRQAAENTVWKLTKGNHDDRLRNETLERAERVYGVTAAQWPGDEPEEWVYSLNHLLHLKRLGIEYVEPRGTYEFEQIPLSEYLAARHGYKAAKGSENAIKTAVELGHSVVLGHTHRQSIVRKTLWNTLRGTWEIYTGVEAGCMCQIKGGLGYANAGAPDWQQGFATVNIWPDGRFSADLATYEQSGTLRWRDQLFT